VTVLPRNPVNAYAIPPRHPSQRKSLLLFDKEQALVFTSEQFRNPNSTGGKADYSVARGWNSWSAALELPCDFVAAKN
jgi:hypothetical protein